jgi:hypothetical protein
MPRILPLALAAFCLITPAAQACDDSLSRPFTPWLDFAQYTQAPNGDFASTDGWTLDGAALAGGALSVPAGASALSAPVCVTPAHPTLRFFAAGTGTMTVSVVSDGLELPIGAVVGGGAWAPTLIMPIVLNLLGDRDVQFRFTGVTGNLRIDDVWVDPYSKG